MNRIQTWFYVTIAVLVAILGNSVSTIWAEKGHKFDSLWFLSVLVISPFVFITFGLVASKLGLAESSATIDSLLTIGTVIVGLLVFGELNSTSIYQYFGIFFALLGIILMQFKS